MFMRGTREQQVEICFLSVSLDEKSVKKLKERIFSEKKVSEESGGFFCSLPKEG